ncbi:MAG: hypothetical protein OEW16_11395 [Gammaproteobacteria bacterium]|nr:hypothetical protein [Gammaproteobacteria bacterium]
MQHRIVRRVSWGIVAGLCVAAWLFAIALRQPPGGAPQPAGEPAPDSAESSAFVEYCGACHHAKDLAQTLSSPDAAATMVQLLGQHGMAPLQDDLRIVAELVELNGGAVP